MLQNYHTKNALGIFDLSDSSWRRFSSGLRYGKQATLVALVNGQLKHIARIRLAHSAYSSFGTGLLEFFSVPSIGLIANHYYVHRARYSWSGEGVVLALLQKCFNVSCNSDGYRINEALRKIAEYFGFEVFTVVHTMT